MASSSSPMHIILLVYCVINFVVGLALLACGVWFHASADVYAYMTVYVPEPHDSTFVSAAALMLVAGLLLAIISVLAVLGVILKIRILLYMYVVFDVIVIILALIGGFMAVGLYWDNHHRIKKGMRNQMLNRYDMTGKIGLAWSRVQVKKRCCGVDGSWDYQNSDWYNNVNPVDAPPTAYVPRSCCTLNFNQDRELFWVDPQNLQLKDLKKCQEDAAGRVRNSANLHGQGCFAALQSRNKDLWHDVSIFTVLSVIQGLCLAAGFLQIFGFIIVFFYLKATIKTLATSRPVY